jgi:uncharacterized membrane protein YqhA
MSVSIKVVSSQTEVIEAMRIIMAMVIVVMIVLYMNNFLLVMHFVDNMWDMHSDMYTANKKKQK